MFEDIVLFKEKGFALGFSKINHIDINSCRGVQRTAFLTRAGSLNFKRRDIDIALLQYSGDRSKAQMLNIPLCRHLNKENIMVAFSLSEIINTKERWITMSKMMQDIRMCRKYKIKMLFASFARTPEEQAGAYEIYSLARVLGMMPGEAKTALSCFSKIPKESRKFGSKIDNKISKLLALSQ